MNKSFLKDNLIILILMNSGNVFSYLFQFVIGRSLTPSEYGAFNAINSLLVLATAPMLVISLVVSKFTVEFNLKAPAIIGSLFHRGLNRAFYSMLGVWLIGGCFAPWIRDYMHVEQMVFLAIIIVQGGIALPQAFTWGISQGLEGFTKYGILRTAPSIIRLLLGFVLVIVIPWGVGGALMAGLLASVFGTALGIHFLYPIWRRERMPIPPGTASGMIKYSIPVFLTSFFTLAMGNLDMILVRHYCDAQSAGMYASSTIIGRIAFYLPGVLGQVLFPVIAKRQAQGVTGVRELLMTTAATSFIAFGFAGVCLLFPAWVLRLFFGASYLGAQPVLQIVSLAMAVLSISNVMFTFNMAQGRTSHIPILGAAVASLFFSSIFFHETPMQIAYALLIVNAGALIGTSLAWLPRIRKTLAGGL